MTGGHCEERVWALLEKMRARFGVYHHNSRVCNNGEWAHFLGFLVQKVVIFTPKWRFSDLKITQIFPEFRICFSFLKMLLLLSLFQLNMNFCPFDGSTLISLDR